MPSQGEISARLNGDNSNFRSAMNQAERVAGEAGKRITKNLDLRDASRTMAAAIGLNIQDIANGLARILSGVSKEAEENFKKIAELSDQIAAKTISNNLARLNDDQRQILLLKERASIEAAIANNKHATQADELAMKENLLRLANITGEIEKRQRADAIEENKRLDQMISDNRERQEKAVAEAGARRQQQYDAQTKADEEHSKYVDQHIELLTLESKVGHGITEEENRRLDVLRLQTKALEIQSQIKSLLSLEKRTPQEEAALQSLYRQNTAIQDQINLKTQIVEKVEEQAVAEEHVGDVIEFATNKLKSYVAEWTGFMVKVTTFGRGDKELSDRELERKISNIKSDIANRENVAFNAMGDPFGGSGYDPFLDAQRSNLGQTLAEQNLRSGVRSYAAAFGKDAAFNRYDGLSESRFNEILGPVEEQVKQTSLLQQILDQQRKGIVTVPMGT